MEILFSLIFNPYFLILTTLTCFLPLALVLRLWISIAIIGCGFLALQTQPQISSDQDVGYVIGRGLLTIYAVFISVIFITRLAIQKIRKKELRNLVPKSNAVLIADLTLFLMAGIVVSLFISRALAFSLESFPYGFIIHGGLIFISIGLIGAALKFMPYERKHSHFKFFIFKQALLCGLLLFFSLGVFYPYLVTQSAQKIAEENPYCIGLNGRSRALSSLEDLTILTMDKNSLNHHAFLLVHKNGEIFEPYHWSYLQSKFLPGVVNWKSGNSPSIPCRPAPNFIKNIPLISNSEIMDIEFYVHDYFLKIPQKYAPHVSSHYISISAQPPIFMALNPKNRSSRVSMEIISRAWIENLQKNYISQFSTGKIGNLNGAKSTTDNTDWYYKLNNDGKPETVIGCYPSRASEIECQHRFYRNGAMYTFYHSKDLLFQSDEMEQNLFDLFESFKEH